MTDVLSVQSSWSHNSTSKILQSKSTRRTVLRKLTFFRNGDQYFTGKKLTISPQQYMNLRHLLQDLSSSIDLPYGVRRLFTPDHGSEITDISILKDGGLYVCASFEPFRKLHYPVEVQPHVTFNLGTRM